MENFLERLINKGCQSYFFLHFIHKKDKKLNKKEVITA